DDHFNAVDGTLSSSDRDSNDSATYGISGQTGDTSRSGYDLSKTGSYGTLYLNSATGAYSYVPNDGAINALTSDASETFTLSVTDASSASDSQVLNINLTAANDTPEITASLTDTTYVETAADDTFNAVTGTLSGSDRDTVATATYAITGSSPDTSLSGYDRSKAGTYGTLYLNSVSGAYTYIPNDAAIEGLTAGVSKQDSFTFERIDDQGAKATTGFTAWIAGAADAPIISEGGDAVSLRETDAALTTEGSITVTDNDLSDAVTLTVSNVAVGGTSTATHPANATLLGMLQLTPSSLLSDGSSISDTVTWRFDSGSEAFDYLSEGETLVLTYTLNAADNGSPSLSTTDTVIITITGSNDGPLLVSPATISLSDTASDDSFTPVTGTLVSSDSDQGAAATYSIAGAVADSRQSGFDHSIAGHYGTLYLNSTTGGYSYVPNDVAIEALKADSSEQFSVRVSDGLASDSQVLTVSITAVNDTPTIQVSTTSATYTDTVLDDAFTSTVSGTLSSDDRDGDATTYSVAGEQSGINTINGGRYDRVKATDFGDLYLNSQSGSYTFVANAAAINSLKADSHLLFSFSVSDGLSSASELLTIHLVAANDTPELTTVSDINYTDTADDDHFNAVDGTLSSSDRDSNDSATYGISGQTGDTSRSGYDLSKTGSYGTLYLNSATGAYSYVPNDGAINALTSDASETFTLSVTDASSASDSQVLNINLTAANDTPEITASLTDTTYVETAADDTFNAVTGTLSGSDRDTVATATYAITGSSPDTSLSGYDRSKAGTYGTLYLNSVSGAYTYIPNDAAIEGLTAGVSKQDSFTFERIDDQGAKATTGFTAWIAGAADAPIISEGGDAVSLRETDAALTTEGSITVTDNDLSDAVTLTVSNVAVGGTSTATHPANATLLGMLQLTPSSLLSDGSSISDTVTWRFDSGSEAFDYLSEGETLVLTYTLNAADNGSPSLSTTDTVIITITGSNDGPLLVSPATISLSDTASDDSFTPVTGTLVSSDSDQGAAATYSIAGAVADSRQSGFDHSIAGHYGTLYLNSTTGGYSYVPNDVAIEALKADSSEQFSVRVSDGLASDSQVLTVSITAVNDTPTIQVSTTSATYTDTALDDAFSQTVSGILTSADRDGSETAVYSLINQVANTAINGFDYSSTGTYGSLYLNSNSGAYQFVANPLAINALSSDSTESYGLIITDGSGVTAQTQFVVSLVAANDTPQIELGTGDSANINIIESEQSATGLSANGTLTATDRDTVQTATVSVQSVVATGVSGDLGSSNAQLLGMLTVDAGNVLSSTENSGTINWVFDSGSEYFDYLAQGERLSLTYTVRLIDSQGGFDDQTIIVNVIGRNDPPSLTISAPAGFVELVDSSTQTLSQTGTVNFDDVDASDLIDVSYQSNNDIVWSGGLLDPGLAVNLVSGFKVSAVNVSAPGSVSWEYAASSLNLDFLADGETVTFSYMVIVTDRAGVSVSDTISFTLTGTNDQPVIDSITEMGALTE
ncbi:MAG: hypothetical protein GYB18_03345, partial [Oceanospirillales bacterium]|nr:hypothetical protein [Oceanospirillales bacterium]